MHGLLLRPLLFLPSREGEDWTYVGVFDDDSMKSDAESSVEPWLVLVGATASGKSEVAVELAREVQGEIVSADSMQIYRGMNIGTAKPSLKERRGVPHHLFDVLDLDQRCNVADFRMRALEAIASIQSRGGKALLVGGSGLYIRALTQGLFEGPGRDERLRTQLEGLGTEELRQRLLKVDPISAKKMEEGDRRRIIRALECHALTGRPISTLQTQWNEKKGWRIVGLNRSRDELYERCDTRVDRMFREGFVEEVELLMSRGLETSPTASRAIGYVEIMRYLRGELSWDETVKIVKQKTRNFVKRQWTWFRKEPGIHWIEIKRGESSISISQRILAWIDSEN